jgi:purine-nucleoside phosphorylase
VPAPAPAQPALVAVGDHANLTWRSPLWGPDDGTLGERFPRVAGLYRADVVIEAFAVIEAPGRGPVSGVVAGVHTHGQVTEFVRGVMAAQGWTVWSAELVPVALVAAHLGLGVAAVVVQTTAFLNDAAEGEDGS